MLDYDQTKQVLDQEVSSYLKKTNRTIGNSPVPEVSYKDGVISVSLNTPGFLKSDIINAIDVLNRYYGTFSEFRTRPNYTIIAKLGDGRFRDRNDHPMCIDFGFDPTIEKVKELARMTTGKEAHIVFFRKSSDLAREEIDCILDFWKQYSLGNEGVEENLKRSGAVFYDSNEGFTWDSIRGYEQVKQDVKDSIILPFKHPEIYKGIAELTRTVVESNTPRAVLFEGPPGTGKTTMARVIANESQLPLIYIPIESIMSKWYGESENKLAKVFDEAKKVEQSILFLDEIDSLAGSRDRNMHEATRRILSVLLRKLQGFESIDNVLTIGATNRTHDLDHALLSRFNRTISFPLPDIAERSAIFNYYAKHLDESDLDSLAELTANRSGRDIEDICGDAERIWAREIIKREIDVCTPSIEIYVESVKSKFNGVEE